jgi:KaiC
MSETRELIRSLPSGVPGLDAVLGGGLPEYSFNVIAGGPGVGKTTLAQQIAFAAATPERPALYFTVMGEPTFKLLRYQSQFGFFDAFSERSSPWGRASSSWIRFGQCLPVPLRRRPGTWGSIGSCRSLRCS